MKMNNKIIIHNYTDLEDMQVLNYLISVVSEGKVSETSKGKQYCFATTFESGIIVTSDRNKNVYRFIIRRK